MLIIDVEDEYNLAGVFDPGIPAAVARAKRVYERKRTLSVFKYGVRLNFIYFRRRWSILKKGGCLNLICWHNFANFNILIYFDFFRGFAPQNASARFPLSKMACAYISRIFVENVTFSKKECAQLNHVQQE